MADDSETVQKVVNLTFELEGIEVITFSDGDSAMEQFSAVAPDVVLADVNMPGLSGYEICQNIKSNELTKNTPVILLVGSFEPFDEQKAMEVGADDYLTKPFQSIRQLVSKVNELLAAGKTDFTNDRSFEETLSLENSPYLETDFGDPGMDDEMIQTNQIGSIPADETAKFETQQSFQNTHSEDTSKTQPLSQNDFQEINPSEQKTEESEQTVYELAEEHTENPENAETGFIESEAVISNAPDSITADEKKSEDSDFETVENNDLYEKITETKNEEDFGLQPDDIDHFYKEQDYQEEENDIEIQQFPDLSEQTEIASSEEVSQTESGFEIVDHDSFGNQANQSPEAEPEFLNSDETRTEIVEEIETATEHPQMSMPVPAFDFDDLDLLDISFPQKQTALANEQKFETQTPETVTPTVEKIREVEPQQVKNEVAEQLSGVNLSAADIDAIAEKVVEKLSARMKE
ncbi:MAG: response regulator [Pyrinomonadaceae bacterium]